MSYDSSTGIEGKILISVDEWEIRVVLVQEEKVVEYYFERKGNASPLGNIYLGRVKDTHKALGSAFVNIGLDRNAFLTSDSLLFDADEEDVSFLGKKIEPNDEVIVQVVRKPRDKKGARLSLNVSIPGRYLVLFPMKDFIAASKKLQEDKREKLTEYVSKIKPKNFGLIVRTLAEESSRENIEKELDVLLQTWHGINSIARRKKPPQLLYREPDLPIRIVRDLLTSSITELLIDDRDYYLQIKGYLNKRAPELISKIKLYEKELPLFEMYGIERQLDKLKNRVVWLRSGGFIVIDQTEALTAIDVNSGKNTRGRSFEETAFISNIEAAEEIPRSIRLRDIGGIIVIDFIDMKDKSMSEAVEESLRNGLKKDRSQVSVCGISPLGLVEITRKSISNHTLDYFEETCSACNGKGCVLSSDVVSISFLRNLKKLLSKSDEKAFVIKVNPRLKALLESVFLDDFKKLLNKKGKEVELLSDALIEEDDFKILFKGQTLPDSGGQILN